MSLRAPAPTPAMDQHNPTDPAHAETLRRLTEHVLALALDGELDQGLLDAAMDLGAGAAAVWRPLSGGGTEDETWQPVRSRGDSHCLPPNSLVRAHFEGHSTCTLPLGARALGGGMEGLGLVIGPDPGATLDAAPFDESSTSQDRSERWFEDCADLLEALLITVNQLTANAREERGEEAADQSTWKGPLERLSGLLPSPDPEADDADEEELPEDFQDPSGEV